MYIKGLDTTRARIQVVTPATQPCQTHKQIATQDTQLGVLFLVGTGAFVKVVLAYGLHVDGALKAHGDGVNHHKHDDTLGVQGLDGVAHDGTQVGVHYQQSKGDFPIAKPKVGYGGGSKHKSDFQHIEEVQGGHSSGETMDLHFNVAASIPYNVIASRNYIGNISGVYVSICQTFFWRGLVPKHHTTMDLDMKPPTIDLTHSDDDVGDVDDMDTQATLSDGDAMEEKKDFSFDYDTELAQQLKAVADSFTPILKNPEQLAGTDWSPYVANALTIVNSIGDGGALQVFGAKHPDPAVPSIARALPARLTRDQQHTLLLFMQQNVARAWAILFWFRYVHLQTEMRSTSLNAATDTLPESAWDDMQQLTVAELKKKYPAFRGEMARRFAGLRGYYVMHAKEYAYEPNWVKGSIASKLMIIHTKRFRGHNIRLGVHLNPHSDDPNSLMDNNVPDMLDLVVHPALHVFHRMHIDEEAVGRAGYEIAKKAEFFEDLMREAVDTEYVPTA